MATIPTFNSTVIARVAAGLYDLQLGNETMDWALEQVNFGTSVEELAQSVYDADFGGMDYEEVAALLVANLGISARNSVSTAVIDIANTVVEDALTAGGAGNEGATIVSLVNLFSTLTTHPDVGLANAAKAFNSQIVAAVNYAEIDDTVTVPVHPPEEALNFLITPTDIAGLDAMRLTGDTDVRIDFTNPNQQVTGLDVDGDGLIEFNGTERTPSWLEQNIDTIGDNHSGFEIIDAYSRNPLDHTDTANNFTGDIYFDGSSFSGADGDGTKSDGNIFLGGLGEDTAFGGVGNDFLAGGSIAQGEFDDNGDYLAGGRNADFFFAEFSQLDLVDGGTTLYVDGGNTSDDQPAGKVQSDQDSDWLLVEASDDDEPVFINLDEASADDDTADVDTRSGEEMDIDDVENLDASGNLYGFLDDLTDGDGNQLRVGDRATDSRYEDGANEGSTNYGIGSSAQLDIVADDNGVGNIIIAGYDNDSVDSSSGNDLLFGGNLQFLFETVEDSATNLNLESITLDGLDALTAGTGNDGIAFESDGGSIAGGDGTDTLWVTNYALGTNTASAAISGDQVLRFDLGAQAGSATSQDAEGEARYTTTNGANRSGTADQTNYNATSATNSAKANTVTGIEIVDASGLSAGVRGLDYYSAGTNSPEVSFDNRQNFHGYNGDLDLRGELGVDNQLYAGAGDDVIEARGGTDAAAESATTYDNSMMGGAGDDTFIFAIEGDASGDETNIIRRKVDANGDGFWDGATATNSAGTWGKDFGEVGAAVASDSTLTLTVPSDSDLLELTEAVQFILGGTTYKVSGLAGAQSISEFADKLEEALADVDALDGLEVDFDTDDGQVVVTDPAGAIFAKSTIGWFFVDGGIPPDGAAAWAQTIGDPDIAQSRDLLVFKSYEDRSDDEGVDDDSITGSTISLGEDAYAEDLVVSFAADGTRLAEDQEYVITFTNLTTEDKVTVSVNGVTYELTVGIDVNGTQLDDEDTVETDLDDIQTNFLARLAGFINSFMDDDTAAGQVAAASTATTLTLTQVAYSDGEETVFMSTPVVSVTNASGGEKPTSAVDNDAQTEVFLYQFDGRNNELNSENVLFWGQEAVSRSILETAANGTAPSAAGDTLVGSEAIAIDGGFGAGDDDLAGVPQNKATDRDFDADTSFQEENFVVHGDDYLIGGTGDDTISGMTGDDRVRGSLGNDTLDGGNDWYAVKEDGDSVYTIEYLNAYEAAERDEDGEVLDIQLLLQTEDGINLLAPSDDSPTEEYEAYFDDTLIYHQADFTAGVTRFTITLNDYIGIGEDIEFDNGGAGTVGVDANGDGTVEADNVSTFTNFENIRTVSGIGFAVAGANGGQGRDTLNVNALSDDADVGVQYDLTGDGTAGDVSLIEDLDDDEDTAATLRKVIAVDGVENVVFGDGDDVLLIDETEAAKDNVITGDLGEDVVAYQNNFDGDADAEPTVTIVVGNAHGTATDAGTDLVEMTEGRVGTVLATDTLNGIEVISLQENTAAGIREDDELNVENLGAGATVNYITGEVLSDTDGDLDFDDGVLQLTIEGIEEIEFVVADGKDAVVVADADTMSDNERTDDDPEDLTINSHLNYDLLDERGDAPERLTISELRAIDGGTADTADENDIPEGYNFAQFNFLLGADTDTVDYSEADDAINAVITQPLANKTQYVMVDGSDGGLDDEFDGVDEDEEDRVDALVAVERVVASQGESVLDFTSFGADVEITFQYTIDEDEVLDADDGYSETNTVRIADGDGDTIQGLTSFVERYTAEDGDVTNATWSRVEGSDFNETVIYEGSEDLEDQFAVDHRFSNDELNLRGGVNTVSYSPLETSITATINVNEYDPLDPTADQIDVTVEFQDGDRGDLNANEHHISSYASDNEIAAGSLKLEASQDAEDTLVFEGDTSNLVILGQSPGVITVEIGDFAALTLTGFEFLQDSEGDDVYDMRDLDNIFGDLELIDSDVAAGAGETTADRDTIKVYDDVVDFVDDESFEAVANGTISLEVLNDVFQFDFDVLDITGIEDEDDLVLIGDDDDHDSLLADGDLNEDDADYEDDIDHPADYDQDGETDARDLEDDVLVGDLGLIDSIELFDGLWLTDASLADGDEFILDTTNVDYSFTDGDGDEFFPIIGGIDELNFSQVTEDVTVLILGNDGIELLGGSGDDDLEGGGGNDTITGNGGADDLDGGQTAETWEFEITAAMANDASGDDIDVEFEGPGGVIYTVTITEGVEIPEGAGITQISNALLAALNAELDDINAAIEADVGAGDAYDGVSIASVELDGAILRFTFDEGTDIDEGTSFVNIASADADFGVSALDVVTDGSDGGDDTFVYNAVSESTAAAFDQIANFSGSTGDVIDLSGVNEDSLPVVLEDLGDQGDFSDFDPEDFFNDDDEFNILAVTDGTDGRLYIDADGDGDLDMVIELLGQTTTDEFDGAGVEVIG